MLDEQSRQLRAEDIAGPASFDRASPRRRCELRAAHIRIFYELSHLASLVSVSLGALIGVSLYGEVPTPALLGWVTIALLIAGVRFYFSRKFARVRPTDEQLPGWERGAWIGALLQGVTWCALLPLASYSERPADLFAVFFLTCALGFGAFATLGFYSRAYLAFSVPILVAIFGWFVFYVPEMSLWVGLLLIVGATVMSRAGIRATRVLRGALLLGLEREDWVQSATAEKERMQVTLGAIGDGVISTDTDGRVTYLNPSAERLTGWSLAAALGKPLEKVLACDSTADQEMMAGLVARCLQHGEQVRVEGERRLRDRREGEVTVQISASPIRDFGQQLIGVVVVLDDVTELAGLAREISFRAEHDSLTGLPNRKTFEAAIAEAREYSRHNGAEHAVCYLDLDQFKVINDTCGHGAGDELLKALTERLRLRIRDSDMLARLGGDEFGVLLFRCPPAKARQVAEELIGLVRDFRFDWEGKLFSIGVSIGLVPFDHADEAGQVLAAADSACYVAKEQGRNRLHMVDPDDVEVASRHGEMRLTSYIQHALDQGLFRLRLQKIVPLQEGSAVHKAEFLVSMVGVEGDLLPPGLFLPAAERFHMMSKLDRHIVRLVFEYAVSGRPELEGIGSYAINLSGQTLADEEFLPYVIEQLRATGIDPRMICFEITETAVIANLDRALHFIQSLRGEGCRFSLDDFGSGLSSFGYLRRLPVDYLKIDGQFVKDMCDDPINHSIVEAINEVGHIMGLKTVAEFVEDERTRLALQKIGVDYAQGWGIHKPVLLPAQKVKSGQASVPA